MVALSVSTSHSTSPLATASPSFLRQRARVPVSMVGERAIMKTFSGIEDPLDRVHDLAYGRLRRQLQRVVVRHGHVLSGDQLNGGIQVIEAGAGNEPCHVGAHA